MTTLLLGNKPAMIEDKTEWRKKFIDYFSPELDMTDSEINSAPENDPQEHILRCSYCGRKGSEVEVRHYFLGGDICSKCYEDRILSRKRAIEIADQCIQNVQNIYGTELNKPIALKIQYSDVLGYIKKFPRNYDNDVIIRRGKKLDNLWVKFGLPENCAKAAFVRTLLSTQVEQKMRDWLSPDEKKGLMWWIQIHYLYFFTSTQEAKYYESLLEDDNLVKEYEMWKTTLKSPLTDIVINLDMIAEKMRSDKRKEREMQIEQ